MAPSSRDLASPVRGAPRGAPALGEATALDPLVWEPVTASPTPGSAGDRLSFCGEPDRALERAALRLARREAEGLPPPDAVRLAFLLRAAGSPYVWPQAWTLSARVLDPDDEAARFRRFLDTLPAGGSRRCGIARTKSAQGDDVVATVVVDALAELAPLPTRARVGQWLRFDAAMLVPTTVAKVVVLGPAGPPRTVPTTLHGDRVGAAFVVDRAGAFTVQLLAGVDGGPRPVVEASVFADVEPPAEIGFAAAPGEAVANAGGSNEDVLYRMVNAARDSEALGPLARSAALDQAAHEHAVAMKSAGRLAHDAGDGSPLDRLRRRGLEAARAGENVAREATVVLAHRALWASPSHRENLLDPRFRRLGVGVVPDADGSMWICELFADFGDAGIISTLERASIFRPGQAR